MRSFNAACSLTRSVRLLIPTLREAPTAARFFATRRAVAASFCWHVSRATEPTLIGSLSNYAGLTTLTVAVTWVATVVGGCATQTEPCHIGGMFTYDVTATGPLGFQVSVTRPHPRGTNLIDDFRLLAGGRGVR